MSMIAAVWRCRWGLARLGLCGFLLWAIAADTASRLARLELSALPGFDAAGEIASLRAQGRFGEGLVLARAALEEPGPDAEAVRRELELTKSEQDSWLRRLKDAGRGAVTGRGDSLESLVGAVVADMFVVGDVRDLLIQGTRLVMDGESDELILALSTLGVVTTLAPEIDWVPSVLKAAKKAGSLGQNLAASLTRTIKGGKVGELTPVLRDVRKLAETASPGGAVRLLRHAEEPEDIARLARFLEREGEGGAAALHVLGREGAELAMGGAPGRLLKQAARKGRSGAEFLRGRSARALLRPHPLIGLVKAVGKGNAADLVNRVLERVGGSAWWVIPALSGWFVVEVGILVWRVGPGRHRRVLDGAESS